MIGQNLNKEAFPPDFLDTVFARCVEEGDCWIWGGPTNNGTPIIGVPASCAPDRLPRPGYNFLYVSVRRAVFSIDRADAAHIGSRYIVPSCCNELCVKPAHARAVTTQEMARRMGKKVNIHARSAKCARTRRERDGKLSQSQVDRVRSGSESAVALAKEWGVNPSLIYRARRGDVWKNYDSPMGAMAAQLVR